MKAKKWKRSFAESVFDDGKMRKYLPKRTYKAILKAQQNPAELTHADKDIYAKVLCRWAQKLGATRYTHWFQPLNNYTAEKRDCIYSLNKEKRAVVKFRGKELCRGEGDGSSFPNGGMRQTFEARGITQWDYTGYAFVKDGYLCIPTTFTSNNFEVLDKKTPLLRSTQALSKQAIRVLRSLGYDTQSVCSVVGAEQEYFLVDKSLYQQRKDLVYTGRTLFGAEPPKGQECDDHYFRPPNSKIAQFMQAVDEQLWKLGILVKTEHNEVAPHQYELAPCYTKVNFACDHNQLTMETIKKVAEEHGLACLLHEKPFACVNGSGKHNNWSLLTDKDENLFEMGDTPRQHARFLLFVCAVIKAIDDYSELLLASVSSFGNDCRLGGYEAPPQVLSVYLGQPLSNALSYATSGEWRCGEDPLPMLSTGTDRNRTSPFAFTANKFEFRMVGAPASICDVNTALNTAVAESLRQFADVLENSSDRYKVTGELIADTFAKHKRIVFDGNNYSDSWADEAKLRGLKSAKCVNALESMSKAHNLNLLERHGVLTHRETLARQQVLLQNYANAAKIECKVAEEMYHQQIAPAVENYLKTLAETVNNMSKLGVSCEREKNKIEKISKLLKLCNVRCNTLHKHLQNVPTTETVLQQARYCESTIPTSLCNLRKIVDKLERLCPRDLWPLPSYGQMLFDESNQASTNKVEKVRYTPELC